MSDESPSPEPEGNERSPMNAAPFGVAIALAALAAVGTGLVIQRLLEQRLSRPEVARLRFYRYLRERGRLES